MRLLRDAFRADLRTGHKVFVHKCAQQTSAEDMHVLHAAIRRTGLGRLLIAQLPAPELSVGSVHEVSPGLYVGALPHFVATGGDLGIAYAAWRDLCLAIG